LVSQCRGKFQAAAAKKRRGGWPTLRLTMAVNALALA
jgi:hypothetical protein